MRRGLDRADLQQIGAIGLIKAADRYDPSQSAPFEAYAWLLIVGELMHHVRDGERVLRAPRGMRELERRWNAAQTDLYASLGREPSESEIAQAVGATPHDVREVQAFRASGQVLSFDSLHNAEGRGSDYGYEEVLDRLTVDRILQGLPPLQRRIVTSIHIDGLTVVEVAARLGYSRRHVTRLHRAALERLKVAALERAEMHG